MRFIVHVDMDAFFAAIEQRDNPKFRAKPVIVGADPKRGEGRGVVSTCSYEARKFGIHSTMPISTAYKKCPKAIFLPVNMEKYNRVSGEIYEILYDFTPQIEPVSIDEAFLDITGSFHLFGTPLKTCTLIKSKIKSQTGLTASLGLAPTKMAAKIASDLEKPDGLVEVSKKGLLDFLWPLSVGKIWGLGKKSQLTLHKMGIRTIGGLAKTDLEMIREVFGKNGEYFWQLANGIDESKVETMEEIKSISNEVTFPKDTLSREKIKGALVGLCEKVSGRLRQEGFKGRTITLKIRLSGFATYTRATTLISATNFIDTIYKAVEKLFDNFNLKGKKVRLVGVKVSNLVSSDIKDSLFEGKIEKKQESIHKAIDKIKEKFGNQAIYRAGSMRKEAIDA